MAKADLQLEKNVQQELVFEPSINASAIRVTANDGVVVLKGKVATYAEKRAAVHAAERISGARAVTDELLIELSPAHERKDEDIAKAALNALQWDVWVPSELINIVVEDGWITLEGAVPFKYQQDAAENVVRNLIGVRGVSNQTTIKKPPANSVVVKAHIENALLRAADVQAHHINVDVTDGLVILRGKVASWAERKEAERAAWSAPGVEAVEDHLIIAA